MFPQLGLVADPEDTLSLPQNMFLDPDRKYQVAL
jgi:hypothetical protein